MQAFDKIQDYAKAVCGQIRWGQAHAAIAEEIENHIIDQRDAYICDGMDETAATQKAIAQMGDHVTVGTLLDRAHRPKPQWGMILLTAALLLTGFAVRFMIGSDEQWPITILSAVVGLGLMTAVYYIDFTLIGKYPKTVYFAILGISIGTFYLFKGDAGLTALLLPLGFATIVYAARNKGYWGIVLCGLSFLLPACLLLMIPTCTGLLLFAVSGFVILCTAISRGWFGVKILNGYLLVCISSAVTILLFILGLSHDPCRWERLEAILRPSIDPLGAGYISVQIKALLGGSNLFGHGVVSAAIGP